MKKIRWALTTFAVAGGAWANVGSVISSFEMTAAAPAAMGIYRDANYVYAVVPSSGGDYLRVFTAAGSPVNSYALPGAADPRDADCSLLGTSYIDVLDVGTSQLLTYTKAGSWVKATPIMSGATAYAYNPGAPHYYLARAGVIYRYSIAGEFLTSFNFYAGGILTGLAATAVFGGTPGDYVIIGRGGSPGLTYVYTGDGSMVANFVVPGSGTEGSVVGAGVPSSYGLTYWCNQTFGTAMWAYQVDILGVNNGLAPASWGRCKALYR
jgi:hypothetical protein